MVGARAGVHRRDGAVACPSESCGVQRAEQGADAERRSSPWQWGAVQIWHALRLIRSPAPDAKRIVPRKRAYDFIRQSGAEAESANWQDRKPPTAEQNQHPRICDLRPDDEPYFISHRSLLGQKASSHWCGWDDALECVLCRTEYSYASNTKDCMSPLYMLHESHSFKSA